VQFPQSCGRVPAEGWHQADRHPGEIEDLLFHIDVNVCRRAGADPVAFMKQYPGKTECLLLTDGPPTPTVTRRRSQRRHAVEGSLRRGRERGGVKYYLLTHGATELTPLETVKRDLEQYKLIHG